MPRAYNRRQPGAMMVKGQVRERDGQKCVVCGKTAADHKRDHGTTLEVHRITPGSKYTLEGCVTLCRTCHYQQPKRRRGEAAIDSLSLPSDLADRIFPAASALGLAPQSLIRMLIAENLHLYEERAHRVLKAEREALARIHAS